MEYWWFIVFISAFLVGMVAYFLWRQFFMSPADASEVGAAGSTPDFWDRRRDKTQDQRTHDQRTGTHDSSGRVKTYRVEDEHNRTTEDPNPPLT